MAFKPLDDAPAGSVSFRHLDDTEATTPTAADYLKGAASGVGGLVSGIGYLAEAAGANQLGGSIRGIGDTTQRYWQDSMTPAGQRAAQSQVFDDDPGSALPKLGDRWGQALAMGAAQSAPSMLAAAIPGGIAAAGLRGAAGMAASRGIGGALAPLAAGTAAPIGGWATNLAGNLAARVPTALGFGAAEGAVAGASNAAQWKSDIEQKPLAELRNMPGFAALEAQIGEQAARQQIAEQGAADIMARTALATGGIGALTGGGALGSAFQRVTTGAKGGILGAIGRDAAKEAGQEIPQSGGERAIQNIATRDYIDPSQSITQGVLADALSGGAIGGVMGGVTGGGSHLAKGPLQKAAEASAATTPPTTPLPDTQTAGIPAGTNGIPPGTIPGVHGTQQPAAGLAAAAQNTQQQSPAPGFVRYYHGGSPESVDGPLWFTSDLRDAEGWASRSPEMGIWYVDVPADHPSVAGDPVFGVLPPSRVELPKELAALRRKLQWRSEPVQNTPAAPGISPAPVSTAAPSLPTNQAEPAGVPQPPQQGEMPSGPQAEIAQPAAPGQQAQPAAVSGAGGTVGNTGTQPANTASNTGTQGFQYRRDGQKLLPFKYLNTGMESDANTARDAASADREWQAFVASEGRDIGPRQLAVVRAQFMARRRMASGIEAATGRVEDARQREVAANRMAILEALPLTTAGNTIRRFAAALRDAGIRDFRVSPEERQLIARRIAARDTLQPLEQGPPNELALPEKQAKQAQPTMPRIESLRRRAATPGVRIVGNRMLDRHGKRLATLSDSEVSELLPKPQQQPARTVEDTELADFIKSESADLGKRRVTLRALQSLRQQKQAEADKTDLEDLIEAERADLRERFARMQDAQAAARAKKPFVIPPLTTPAQQTTTRVMEQQAADVPLGKHGKASAPASVREATTAQNQPQAAPEAAPEPKPADTKPAIPSDTGGDRKADQAATEDDQPQPTADRSEPRQPAAEQQPPATRREEAAVRPASLELRAFMDASEIVTNLQAKYDEVRSGRGYTQSKRNKWLQDLAAVERDLVAAKNVMSERHTALLGLPSKPAEKQAMSPDIPSDTGGDRKAEQAATAGLFPGASQEFLARIAKYEDGGEPVVIVRGAFVPDAEYTLYGKGYRLHLAKDWKGIQGEVSGSDPVRMAMRYRTEEDIVYASPAAKQQMADEAQAIAGQKAKDKAEYDAREANAKTAAEARERLTRAISSSGAKFTKGSFTAKSKDGGDLQDVQGLIHGGLIVHKSFGHFLRGPQQYTISHINLGISVLSGFKSQDAAKQAAVRLVMLADMGQLKTQDDIKKDAFRQVVRVGSAIKEAGGDPLAGAEIDFPADAIAEAPKAAEQEVKQDAKKAAVKAAPAPKNETVAQKAARLQAELAKLKPFDDGFHDALRAANAAISEHISAGFDAGEMPVYRVGDSGAFVTISPSTQSPGKIQVTRYNTSGVMGDSQYKTIEEAVKEESLAYRQRMTAAAAEEALGEAVKAEAEYQAKKSAAAKPEPAAPTEKPESSTDDMEKLQEARQLLADNIETKRLNRQTVPTAWTTKLAEVDAKIRGESDTEAVYSMVVEGHPMFDGSPMLRNLIPIKVTSLADAERKLFAAQDLYSKLSGDRAKAKYALSIAKTAQQKKDAQKALRDLNDNGVTEDAVDALRQETLPELQRLVQAVEDKFGSAKPAPAPAAASEKVDRGSIGASLTKEQRKEVLKTLVDVYRVFKAPKESKGFDSRGEEIFGYAYSPEYFVRSDITGKMVRYYVTLPDKRVAHPTELFPDYTQSDVDSAIAKQEYEKKQAELDKKDRIRRLESRKSGDVQSANRIFWTQNKGSGLEPQDTVLYTDGKSFIRGTIASKDKDMAVLGDEWSIVPVGFTVQPASVQNKLPAAATTEPTKPDISAPEPPAAQAPKTRPARPRKKTVPVDVASSIIGKLWQTAVYNNLKWPAIKARAATQLVDVGASKQSVIAALDDAMTEFARNSNGRLGYPNETTTMRSLIRRGIVEPQSNQPATEQNIPEDDKAEEPSAKTGKLPEPPAAVEPLEDLEQLPAKQTTDPLADVATAEQSSSAPQPGPNDDVAEQLARFESGNYGVPSPISANLSSKSAEAMAKKANAARRAAYDKAAKQFLEGALTAAPPKQPSSARDRIQTENLENVDPRPVGRNVAVAKTFAAKFKAMLDIAGNKDVRYYLNGVHIEDGGRMVATDGARIAIVDGVDVSSAPKKPEKAPGYAYTVLGRDGQWIDGKFVDYMRVWPDISGQPSFTVDAQKLGDHARGITKASRYTDTGLMKDSGAEGDFRFEEKPDVAFSSKYISDAADLFRRLGYQQIKVTVFESGSGKPVALYSPDGKVKQVIMPRRAASWVPLFKAFGAGEVNDEPSQGVVADKTEQNPAKKATSDTSAAAKIDDFGEKLEGARKDYATQLKDAMDVDVASEPLSKSWPEPDYQKLLDGGSDPYMVAFVRAARDELPTKPQKGWKLAGWVKQAEMLRDMAQKLLSGNISASRVREMLQEDRFKVVRDSVGNRAELYEIVGHGRSLKGVTFAHHFFSLYKGQENVSKWVVEQRAKATAFSNWPRELAVGDTKGEALAAFKEKFASLDLGSNAKRQPQFVVYRKRGETGAWIGKKIGREYIDLHKTADVAEARKYMSENLSALEAKLARYKETPFERKPENQPRVGDDHRNGAPVTPEVFAETFGFRGVQFGNYVEQGRRQSDLNEAFDGLMDLAAVLGVPPRALSLNGRLGLAFGSRGRGGRNAPAAHFEPDRVVINLTKGGGPGSLAHEWWHSLDNYFAKQSNDKSAGFVTSGAGTNSMRDALRASFNAVKLATSTDAYRRRSAELDKRRSKPYWNMPEERSARAFEGYVIAKLFDQGAANDYLANVVSNEAWDITEDARSEFFGGGESQKTYPYPTVDEMPVVRAAFDEFFKTVETKAGEDGNVVLYSGALGKAASPADRAIYSMAAEGKPADEILSFISKASRRPFNRVLAAALRRAGLVSSITLDTASRFGKQQGAARYAAAYNARTDTVALFTYRDAERHVLHELVHAATMKAIAGKGPAAVRMRALFRHVQKSGRLDGRYGMTDVDEFVAEAFSNPRFQEALRGIPAPAGSTLKSAWQWFVRIVARIVGIRTQPSETALDRALTVGAQLMNENAALAGGRGAGGDTLYSDAGQPFDGPEVAATPLKPGATTLMVDGTERPALNSNGKPIAQDEASIRRFWEWFGGSRAVDSDERPLVMYHGSDQKITEFEPGRRDPGVWFTTRLETAAGYAKGDDPEIYSVYLKANNPLIADFSDWSGDGDIVIDGKEFDNNVDIVKHAIRIGSDSVVFPVGNFSEDDRTWVVFHPDQIKSASDNNGQFSPDNPDIRFNIATDWQQSPVAQEVAKAFSAAARSDEKLSWLNPVQTQYHKAERLAEQGKFGFKRVFDLGQKFLSDISRFAVMAENSAPTLFHQIRSIADAKQAAGAALRGDFGKQRNADVRAIASPLYEGTLYGGGNPMAGMVWSDAQLRSRFGLTDRQIVLYHEAREAVKVSMDEMAKSLIARHAKREKVSADTSGSLQDVAESVRDTLTLRADVLADEAQAEHDDTMQQVQDLRDAGGQDKRAADMQKEAEAKLESQQAEVARIRATVSDVQAIADKAQKLQDAGYFPLMRFGRHTVTAKDENGKVQHFSMHDGIPLVPRSGQAQANKLADALREEHPDWDVTTGLMNPEKYKLYQGMNVDALQLFADHLDDETKQTYQDIIRLATNERSALRRMLKREGTPGFDRDVRRTLASFILSNARYTSSAYHLADMARAAEQAEEDGGDVGAEAVKLYDYVTKPQEEAAKLRGFLFFNFLGGSIAAAMVNATQVPMMTFPRLAQYDDAGKLAARLARAAKMATGNPQDVAGEVGAALRRAEEDGITAPHQIYEMTATAANNIFAGSMGGSALLRAWGAPFAMAESFNRRTTFIAAWQIGRGMTANQLRDAGASTAFEFAEKMVQETQGIYNRGNRVNLGRGAIGSVVMTFKQFSVMYLEMFSRLPPKQKAIMAGMLILAAGAGGLPFAEDIEDIIDTIGQWLGYRTNTRRTIRRGLSAVAGQRAADIAMNGVLSQLGVDLHSRLGLHNILPGSALLKPSTTDKSREFQDLLGPAASVVAAMGQALQDLATGRPDKAALAMAPVAVQNAAKGIAMANTGRATDMRGKPTIPVSPLESLAKGVGFNPKSVADYGTIKRDSTQDDRLIDVTRERFTAAIVDAILADDPDARREALQDVVDWNKRNPDARIAINPAAIRRRVADMRAEGPARVLKSLSPSLRQQARQEFADAQ